MNFSPILVLLALSVTSLAQTPTPPKKDPFKGFGSALDQRPKGYRTAPAPVTPPPGVSTVPSLPSRAAVTTGLTFDAKTVANGGAASGFAAASASSKVQTRVSHPVLEVKVRNMSAEPANAHFDYFFIAGGVDGGGHHIWDHGERDVAMPPGGDHTETIESTAVQQQTVNETHRVNVTTNYSNGSSTTQQVYESSQRQSGSRPAGWIVRMFVGKALVKVQASTNSFEQLARDDAALAKLIK